MPRNYLSVATGGTLAYFTAAFQIRCTWLVMPDTCIYSISEVYSALGYGGRHSAYIALWLLTASEEAPSFLAYLIATLLDCLPTLLYLLELPALDSRSAFSFSFLTSASSASRLWRSLFRESSLLVAAISQELRSSLFIADFRACIMRGAEVVAFHSSLQPCLFFSLSLEQQQEIVRLNLFIG